MWVYAALTVGCFAVWVALFPLAIMGYLGPVGLSCGLRFCDLLLRLWLHSQP